MRVTVLAKPLIVQDKQLEFPLHLSDLLPISIVDLSGCDCCSGLGVVVDL